jgi:amidase
LPSNEAWLSQLSTEGPMGRTVSDVASLLDIQAGFDERAPLSLQGVEKFNDELAGHPMNSTRIGWLGDLGGYLPMDSGILDICNLALQRFEGLGCTVEPVGLGYSPQKVWDAWRVWRGWLVAPRVRAFMGTPERRAQVKPEAQWEFEQGQALTADDVMKASTRRTAFYHAMRAHFSRYDILAIPTAQVWPFDKKLRWPDSVDGKPMDTYHRWMEVAIYATFAGL